MAKQRRALINLTLLILAILSYFFWDKNIASLFFDLSKKTKAPFQLLSDLATPSVLLTALSCFLFFLKKESKRFSYVLEMLIAVGISLLVVATLKTCLGRARPAEWLTGGIYGFFPFHWNEKFYSMPSSHAAAIFAALLSLASKFKSSNRYLIFCIAVLIALTRVILDKHYFSDVLVSLLIAFNVNHSVQLKMHRR